MILNSGIFLAGNIALFLASVVAMIWWHRKQRKRRLPFGADILLLRAPGESQLKHVRKFEEDMFEKMVWAVFAPMLATSLCLFATTQLPSGLKPFGLVLSAIVFLAVFIAAARWFFTRIIENSNRYLGYFGERIVAECLEPLKLQGWRIFHDLPAVSNGHNFNLDHVAVGPAGVFVIETKTFRKGLGNADHKVSFDGRNLTWPWGEDNDGLTQAEGNAIWLAERLKIETGERVHVTPYLTMPGWWVEGNPGRDSRLYRVVNPKGLPKFLSSGTTILDQRQIDTIADKLEARCRDVKY